MDITLTIIYGVVSGLIVYFFIEIVIKWLIFNKIFKMDKKEFFAKVENANNEIKNTLLTILREESIASKDSIKSLIRATARKYNVEFNDLYTERQFIEEVIKEVMDARFLSAKVKNEYCDNLIAFKQQDDKLETHICREDNDYINLLKTLEVNKQKQFSLKIVNQTLTVIMAASAAILTLVSPLLTKNTFIYSNLTDETILFPLLLGLSAILVALFSAIVYSNKYKITKKRENTKSELSKNDNGVCK